MDDLEFDELVRRAVSGIADRSPQPHPFPSFDDTVAAGEDSGESRRRMNGRSRLVSVAVVSAVVLLGGWLVSVGGLWDRSVEVVATDEQAVWPTDSGTGAEGDRVWPTMTPGADLIPLDALEPSAFIFGPAEEAAVVAENYLADRLPDLASIPDGLVVDQIEIVDGHAVFGWSYDVADVSAAGWLYLLRADGSWWVVAATSEGIDAHRFSHGSQGLTGLVTSRGDESLVIDLVDIDTGEPFEPTTGAALPPGPVGRRLGTAGASERLGDEQRIEIETPVGRGQFAIRIQAVGGTALTITEFVVGQEVAETDLTLFVEPTAIDAVAAALEADDRTAAYQLRSAANTRSDYRRLFSDTPELAEIWDEAAELESISVALATTDPPTAVIEDLLQIDGVLAVAPTPSPSSSPELEEQADELVVATLSVPFRPTAITCEAPIGIEAPPNRTVRADVALPAETSEAALSRYLAEAAEPPPWPAGYTKLVSTDGTVAFGYADQPERYLGIVRVEESSTGWTVTEWEIVGC